MTRGADFVCCMHVFFFVVLVFEVTKIGRKYSKYALNYVRRI